jgi:hypothetical protein
VGSIVKEPLTGGSPSLIAAGQSIWVAEDTMLAVDSTDAYWIDNNHQTVMKVSKAGSIPTPVPTILASGYLNLRCLAIDSGYVYWTADTGIYKLSKYGGIPTTPRD